MFISKMKKTKLYNTKLLLFICLFSVQSNAQNIELTNGINFSIFDEGIISHESVDFDPTLFLGYTLGANYCVYTKKDKPVVLSMHLMKQKGRVIFNDVANGELLYQEIDFNTSYFVLGIQPYTYVIPNQKLEISFGIEAVFLVEDHTSYVNPTRPAIPGFSSFYFYRDISSVNRELGLQGKITIAYVYDLKNNNYFVPKLFFRLANLKNNEIVDDERGIGLEFGFRF